jgi:hypothetical protein
MGEIGRIGRGRLEAGDQGCHGGGVAEFATDSRICLVERPPKKEIVLPRCAPGSSISPKSSSMTRSADARFMPLAMTNQTRTPRASRILSSGRGGLEPGIP